MDVFCNKPGDLISTMLAFLHYVMGEDNGDEELYKMTLLLIFMIFLIDTCVLHMHVF
jgi:hypothetical protein